MGPALLPDNGAALRGVKVLELGHGIAGPFAARLLADLGAEVIKIEDPAGGDFARRLAPLVAEGPDGAQESLLFRYLNWNKKSVALDLGAASAKAPLEQLLRQSDIVIDAFAPGRLAQWGFGYEQLRQCNEAVVLTSISNFGAEGELANWQATDLILYAMSGLMSISGKKYPKAPLKHGLRQSLYCAGLNAAYVSLAAYILAQRTGTGEHVDLSIRECLASELVTASSYYVFMGAISGRHPIDQDPFSGDPIDTATGYISMQAASSSPMTRYAEFLAMPELASEEYARAERRIRDAANLRAKMEARLASEDSVELFERACNAALLVGVVQTAQQLLASEQLAERGTFRTLPPRPGEATRPWRYPSELAWLTRTPIAIHDDAPRLGEHTSEVLASLAETSPPKSAETPPPSGGAGRLPMAGLRVVDLSAIVAGPYMGALLADMGAEVIKVEGPQRPDSTRGAYGAFIDNDPSDEPWNRGGSYHILNRGKRSFVCDLSTEKGQELLRALLKTADILIENFTPRVLPKWGLTPEVLEELNPRLIVMSNSGFGATGPWRNFRAQGTTLELTMGMGTFTGYLGGRPSKAGQSYPDYLACWSGLTAICAALIYRERTGTGQRIDQGMYQLGVAVMPEAILEFEVNGDELPRRGAEDLSSLVSGVFESAEHDRWVAVSIRDEADLARLAELLPDLAEVISAKEDDQAKRQTLVQEALGRFIAARSRAESAEALQAIGVPAGPVNNVSDLLADKSLIERGFYEDVDYGTEAGLRPIIGRPFKFAEHLTDGPHIARRGADFGADNRYVLEELLGLDEAAIDALYSEQIVTDKPTNHRPTVPADIVTMQAKGSMAGLDSDYRERFAARHAAKSSDTSN